MPLAEAGGLVAGDLHHGGDGRDIVRQRGAIVRDTRGCGEAACQDRGSRGCADRCVRIPIAKCQPALGQGIDMRSLQVGGAEVPEVVASEIVEHTTIAFGRSSAAALLRSSDAGDKTAAGCVHASYRDGAPYIMYVFRGGIEEATY